MPKPDLVKTGIAGLDNILHGGIPRGNVILVEGGIGVGKTTLGVEFVYRGASHFNEPGIIVLFEVSPHKLMRDAANLGWDLEGLEREGRLKIVFTTREVLRQELQQADSVLLEEAAKIGARRIFVDGVGRLVNGPGNGNGMPETRSSFHVLTEGLQRENLTAILAVEASATDGHMQGISMYEESIADTVMRLRVEEMQRAASRSIEIVKSRGQDFQMGRHTFRIIDGEGIRVYRRVQAPRVDRDRSADFDPDTRIPTGIPGLDELLNGGYYVGSTTVIAGISGVGKSVMALQYIMNGARHGERSLMFSLDEPVGQIERNARSLGMDLKGALDSGLVRVEYEPPQEIEVDVHFAHIEKLVEEFEPRRVVFDSLSTYGSTLGTKGRMFRDFFHALTALMKEHQIAAVYNHENPEMLGMASMMGEFAMSSLVDNIILMNWIEISDSFRLGLTVAKMRANPVDRVTRECEIASPVGLRVLPRVLPVPEKKAFSTYAGLLSRAPTRWVRKKDEGPVADSSG